MRCSLCVQTDGKSEDFSGPNAVRVHRRDFHGIAATAKTAKRQRSVEPKAPEPQDDPETSLIFAATALFIEAELDDYTRVAAYLEARFAPPYQVPAEAEEETAADEDE